MTVCNSAADECCPQWFDDPIKLHWGLLDLTTLQGSEEECRDAFYVVIETIEKKVKK